MLQEAEIYLVKTNKKLSDVVVTKTVQSNLNSDFIGVGGSFFCLIHCIAPQMISIGSIGLGISSFFAGEGWVLFFFFTCLFAVWHSAKKSNFLRVNVLLWLALAVFATGLLTEFLTESESIVSYIGSGALIAAHLYNFSKQSGWNRLKRSFVFK